MLYKNIEDCPFRASMRRSNKDGYISRYYSDYGSNLSEFFTWLRNFLKYCVGKPFNEMYSILCKKYPHQIGRINPKREFKFWLNIGDKYRLSPRDYYVDDDGIIRRNERHHEKASIKIPNRGATLSYRLTGYIGYTKILQLSSVLTPKELHDIWYTHKMSIRQYIRIRHSSAWNEIGSMIEPVCEISYVVIPKGTRLYSKLRAEERASKRKIYRDSGKNHELQLAEYLSKKKLQRKEMQKEMRRKQREEALRNIIDRDRLGFDEESFMGPNYNSRKGKKLKRLLDDKINQLRESGNNNPSLR